MGIKVFCPSGHKLNVKTFLAGKTGICPHCGIRFSIPKEGGTVRVPTEPAPERRRKRRRRKRSKTPAGMSGSPVMVTAVSSDALSGAVNPVAATYVPDAAQFNNGAAQTITVVDPIAEAPAARWYVQSVSGGRYGPAPGDMMRAWLADGRVSSDSLVWREGWPQWQSAGVVFPQLNSPRFLGGAAQGFVPVQEPGGPQLPINWDSDLPKKKESGIAVSGRLKVNRRSNRLVATVVALLVIVVVLLSVMFVVIFTRDGSATRSHSTKTRLTDASRLSASLQPVDVDAADRVSFAGRS